MHLHQCVSVLLCVQQAEVLALEKRYWSLPDVYQDEAEELERKQNLLKIKLAETSALVREAGMTTGLARIRGFEEMYQKSHAPNPADEKKVFMTLLPIAICFLCLVLGASTVRTHFTDSLADCDERMQMA